MATTLTYGATVLTLPDHLLWTDEFSWTQVQETATYSAAGALLLDRGTKLAGRPITLEGSRNTGWMTRATALTLLAWANLPGASFTLLYRGTSYAVQFSRSGESPLVITPKVSYSDPQASDYCYAVMRFIITG